MTRTSALPALFPLTCALASIGCATSSFRSPFEDPQALAALQADLRLVGGESTWVTRGDGYELVARSKQDLVRTKPVLDEQSRVFRTTFKADPADVVVALRRIAPDGKSSSAAPVTPGNVIVVEAIVADPAAASGGRGERAGRTPAGAATIGMLAGAGRLSAETPSLRVAQAWLSAHATAITGTPAVLRAASGEVDDPRVPDWAEDALTGLAADSQFTHLLTAQLAAQLDSLYPLGDFLRMRRPPNVDPPRASAEEMGRGRGAMGGMGGGRGGMGGGGQRGRAGGRMPPGAAERMAQLRPLQGGALFRAQAMVFGCYLASRESPQLVGALVDALMKGTPIADVLSSAEKIGSADIERLEADWRWWLGVRARSLRG